jgi:hypothetical protein
MVIIIYKMFGQNQKMQQPSQQKMNLYAAQKMYLDAAIDTDNLQLSYAKKILLNVINNRIINAKNFVEKLEESISTEIKYDENFTLCTSLQSNHYQKRVVIAIKSRLELFPESHSKSQNDKNNYIDKELEYLANLMQKDKTKFKDELIKTANGILATDHKKSIEQIKHMCTVINGESASQTRLLFNIFELILSIADEITKEKEEEVEVEDKLLKSIGNYDILPDISHENLEYRNFQSSNLRHAELEYAMFRSKIEELTKENEELTKENEDLTKKKEDLTKEKEDLKSNIKYILLESKCDAMVHVINFMCSNGHLASAANIFFDNLNKTYPELDLHRSSANTSGLDTSLKSGNGKLSQFGTNTGDS